MIDEGDVCPACGVGTMVLPPVEGCYCHICAPCGACESNALICDTCNHEE